jgi:hypothetical protein
MANFCQYVPPLCSALQLDLGTTADVAGAGLFDQAILPFVFDGSAVDALGGVLRHGTMKTDQQRELLGFGAAAAVAMLDFVFGTRWQW